MILRNTVRIDKQFMEVDRQTDRFKQAPNQQLSARVLVKFQAFYQTKIVQRFCVILRNTVRIDKQFMEVDRQTDRFM